MIVGHGKLKLMRVFKTLCMEIVKRLAGTKLLMRRVSKFVNDHVRDNKSRHVVSSNDKDLDYLTSLPPSKRSFRS